MSKWKEQRKRDIFIKKRDENNLVSRAYFKIEEIDKKFNLLKKETRVLELGAAPGGWTQYIKEKTNNILATDILESFKIPDVFFLQGDIFEDPFIEKLLRIKNQYDCVLGDMAPNISGIKIVDESKTLELIERSLEIAKKVLIPGGNFVCKIFQSENVQDFLTKNQIFFEKKYIFKPKSSKKTSSENYLILLKFKI